MSISNARVIWSEGLFLRPHHFQQQERFFESLLDSRLGPLHGVPRDSFVTPLGWTAISELTYVRC